MKNELIKYFNKEFKEFGIEFVDFDRLYPREMQRTMLERNGIAYEKMHDGTHDIRFDCTFNETSYEPIMKKIHHFIDMKIRFRYDVKIDMETGYDMGYQQGMGSPRTVRIEAKLDTRTVSKKLLKSMIGIGKYNL